MARVNFNPEIDPHIKAGKNEVRINCIICDDTKLHMYINMDKKVYYCQKCGAGGKLGTDESLSLSEWEMVIRMNKYELGIKPIDMESSLLPARTLPLCEVLRRPRDMVDENRSMLKAYKYLKHRGISDSFIVNNNVLLSNEISGPYKNTIIFSIYSMDKLKYFVGRKYDGSEPKYVNAPWPKGDTIYVVTRDDYRKIVNPSCFVIVEGIFDAIAVAKAGYKAIALLGKKANNEQMAYLTKMFIPKSKVAVFLDSDAFVEANAIAITIHTNSGVDTTIVPTISGYDPDRLARTNLPLLRTMLNESFK